MPSDEAMALADEIAMLWAVVEILATPAERRAIQKLRAVMKETPVGTAPQGQTLHIAAGGPHAQD
jgi:hypothetical protein